MNMLRSLTRDYLESLAYTFANYVAKGGVLKKYYHLKYLYKSPQYAINT